MVLPEELQPGWRDNRENRFFAFELRRRKFRLPGLDGLRFAGTGIRFEMDEKTIAATNASFPFTSAFGLFRARDPVYPAKLIEFVVLVEPAQRTFRRG